MEMLDLQRGVRAKSGWERLGPSDSQGSTVPYPCFSHSSLDEETEAQRGDPEVLQASRSSSQLPISCPSDAPGRELIVWCSMII